MKLNLGAYCIRDFDPSDQSALVKYANNSLIAQQLKDRFPSPYSPEDARRWIKCAQGQHPKANFAIANEQELIGGIGLELQDDVYRKSAELGYWLAQPFWGKGIVTQAVTAFSSFAFSHFNLVRLYAGVFSSNPASARVLEKAGYRLEGVLAKSIVKNDVLLDQYLYALIRT